MSMLTLLPPVTIVGDPDEAGDDSYDNDTSSTFTQPPDDLPHIDAFTLIRPHPLLEDLQLQLPDWVRYLPSSPRLDLPPAPSPLLTT